MQIEDQLTEIDGEYADEADMDGDGDDEGEAKAKNRKAKKRSPEFGQIEIDEQGTIQIESVGVKEVKVKYYLIDAEILFSRSPFLSTSNLTEQFSYVMPYA